MEVDWDEAKDLADQEKHGPSFQEAKPLFESGLDDLEVLEAEHSDSGDRLIAIGPIDHRLAVVIYTESEEGVLRIIGPRIANERERARYRSYMDGTR